MLNDIKNEKDLPILIVDDDTFVLNYLSDLLSEFGYKTIVSDNSTDALKILWNEQVSSVLTDIKMPGMTGINLLQKIHEIHPDMPVILMTAHAEVDIAIEAIQKGAFDFVCKPFRSEYLISCINKALSHYKSLKAERRYKYVLENAVKSRTDELTKALTELTGLNKEIIQRLATVAEFRDTESAPHFSRISLYTNKITETMNFEADYVETITLASKLHDIGKIAIPDNILLKPDSLTASEWEIMKSHTSIGGRILGGSPHKTLQLAASIALNHHEKWDGSGYPRGLKGNDIPIEGRIIIVCDQYDAIRSSRHYKKTFTHEETVKILTEGDGRTDPSHFDPDVLDTFLKIADVFNNIFETNQD